MRKTFITITPRDVTVESTLARSYPHDSSHLAGDAAELATSPKEAKYACLSHSFLFQQVALAHTSSDFSYEVGQRVSATTGDV